MDQFTKWVEAFPLRNQLAETVAGVVVREFVARFGCPLEIHTDQGRNFESELFKEMCELLEIGKTRTTSYRPSANGQVERYNRSIAQIIRCCIVNRQDSWDLWTDPAGVTALLARWTEKLAGGPQAGTSDSPH